MTMVGTLLRTVAPLVETIEKQPTKLHLLSFIPIK